MKMYPCKFDITQSSLGLVWAVRSLNPKSYETIARREKKLLTVDVSIDSYQLQEKGQEKSPIFLRKPIKLKIDSNMTKAKIGIIGFFLAEVQSMSYTCILRKRILSCKKKHFFSWIGYEIIFLWKFYSVIFFPCFCWEPIYFLIWQWKTIVAAFPSSVASPQRCSKTQKKKKTFRARLHIYEYGSVAKLARMLLQED